MQVSRSIAGLYYCSRYFSLDTKELKVMILSTFLSTLKKKTYVVIYYVEFIY